MLSAWNKRPEVSKELLEYEWEPDPDYPDMIWRKADCVFTFIDRFGTIRVENRRAGYAVQFDQKVPAHVILTACEQAAAECQEHGTSCEPDDHMEPPTVNGEVV